MAERDDELPPELVRAAELLREHVGIEPQWRRSLDERIQRDARSWRRARWSAHPAMMIAAAIMCVTVGAVGTALLHSNRDVTRLGVVQNQGVTGRDVISGDSEQHVIASNSERSITQRVHFDLVAPSATHVTIAGDFNQWNPEALPMQRSADGRTWQVEVRLQPGRYTYGFVIDGHLSRDPKAPQTSSEDFGVPNSVLLVSKRLSTD